MFKLQDDQGIMAQGTLKECVVYITNWLSSKEAMKLYSTQELSGAKKKFYDALKNGECTQSLGFTIGR